MNEDAGKYRFADKLSGVTLDGGWKVLEQLTRGGLSGSNFSVGYLVERQGKGTERAFLKAMDFAKILKRREKKENPLDTLQFCLNCFQYESRLLALCKDSRMSRIVTVLDTGSYYGDAENPLSIVPYLVLELADKGDIRQFIRIDMALDRVWALECLHDISVGLSQLHGKGVAHLDLKPSNVFVFKDRESKVGDLGCADRMDEPSPSSSRDAIPGDPSYAPPELVYGHVESDWRLRHLGNDLYCLGSMTHFIFTGTTVNSQMKLLLPRELVPPRWGGRFSGTYDLVIGHLQDTLSTILARFGDTLHAIGMEDMSGDLTEVVACLCNPNPKLRRYPEKAMTQSSLDLRRLVSLFDRLSRRAKRGLFHHQT
jgi:eukaryotic-like serine/threonine-protein kinase